MSKSWLFLIAPLCLLGSACSDNAQEDGYEVAAPASDLSLSLAQAVQPSDLYVAQTYRGYASAIRYQLTQGTPLASYEARYPGLAEQFITRSWPVVEREIEARMPEMWAAMARVFDDRLEPEEIAQVHDFFTSPTGQRYIAVANKVEDEAVLTEAAANGGLDEQRFLEENMRTAANAITALSDEDLQALSRFERDHALTIRKLGLGQQTILHRYANMPLDEAASVEIDQILADLVYERSAG